MKAELEQGETSTGTIFRPLKGIFGSWTKQIEKSPSLSPHQQQWKSRARLWGDPAGSQCVFPKGFEVQILIGK